MLNKNSALSARLQQLVEAGSPYQCATMALRSVLNRRQTLMRLDGI